MELKLLIQHGSQLYEPVVEESIVWATERAGTPGQLTFSVLKDEVINFSEGDAVRLSVDNVNVFFGFIFTKKRDKKGLIKVTAYDQLRYLKNKDTYVYTNKTASELIKMIASDFNLNVGEIDDTEYKIMARVEDNVTLFDMINTVLDLTLQNKRAMFVVYDDFGKIALKNIANMKLDILIEEETGENFDYTTSIDSNSYNKIKLIYDNEDTGKREVYIAQSSKNMNSWGVLQHYDTLQKGENGKAKADALLEIYNKKTRNLTIKNVFGDKRVRAGCMIAVQLNLGDIKVSNFMLVETCKHTFKNEEHTMDLTLIGGEFVV